MDFFRYQHVERFGTAEVDGINIGDCWVFPKLDGTNCQVFLDDLGNIQCGSRNRQLKPGDNHFGFYEFVQENIALKELLKARPEWKLFGEFLVPHTLKTYRDDAWRRFYVFDVVYILDGELRYLPYELYQPVLEEYSIDYIPPICKITNPTEERLINQLEKNTYLIVDGSGAGEGIVIKNYDFVNKYGRKTWAKIVRNEFREKHWSNQPTKVKEKKIVEQEIVNKYVTIPMIDKVYANISGEDGWHSKNIPQLLSTVYYDLIREETWNFIKEHKRPVIDFGLLMKLTFHKVKQVKPEIFS